MVRIDGDISLFFFTANTVYYVQQVLDRSFLAIYSDQVNIRSLSSTANAFLPYNPVSVMGCMDQYLIANPNTNKSTGPISQVDLADAVQSLNMNIVQSVTAQRLIRYLSESDTFICLRLWR
jgi:hypothetical protein